MSGNPARPGSGGAARRGEQRAGLRKERPGLVLAAADAGALDGLKRPVEGVGLVESAALGGLPEVLLELCGHSLGDRG